MKIFTRLKVLQSNLLLSRDKCGTYSLNNGVVSEITLHDSKIHDKVKVGKSFDSLPFSFPRYISDGCFACVPCFSYFVLCPSLCV